MRDLLASLLFAACLLHTASACMPGYEAERDRLREHLGIEWIPNGLKNTGFQATKPVRHSADLDCNFASPEKCQWKNMEDKHGLDSLDFHLFEKVDFTEFPALQVRPGPSRVAQGEKLLFTGDKKREEQTAMYYSSLVPCQNTTGNLTFTFWVYNEARVEVLLLEDQPDGGYKVVYEKPYLDCGTVHLNTECHAEIPPRETPFRLAIRAYGMENKEGSFVMLDNIIYSAGLCRVAVDLGPNFSTQPLITAAEGKHADTAQQLDCKSWDRSCRWRNGAGGTKGTKAWSVSSSPLPSNILYNMTGGHIHPEGSYAVLYIEQDSRAPLDVIRSDPIQCQSHTENTFSFRFWKTRDVELEVCAMDQMGKVIECHDAPSALSPAPVSLTFRKAEKNFEIAIRVAKFNPDFDSVVIVDDVSYKATLCSDAVSVFDLGEHFMTTPMLSVLLNRHVNSAKELACDFSKRATDCVWGSTESNNGEDSEIAANAWTVGHGPLNDEKFYSLTGQTALPEGEFAVARFETGGATLLLSEVVRCVIEDASVSFRLWTTGTAKLQVCLVEESSPSLLDCQDASSGPVLVDLPPIDRPFRVALKAHADDQGLVLVDDIRVTGEICPSVVRQFSSKSFRPAADQPDPNVCHLLTCDFHRGHSCLYESSQVPKSARHEIRNHQLHARLDKSHSVAILESVPFRLNAVARLHFDYEVHGDAILFVCNDSGNKELESCFKVEGTSGDDYIELLPSDTKVYLIGRLAEGGRHGILAVKSLSLTDVLDNPAC